MLRIASLCCCLLALVATGCRRRGAEKDYARQLAPGGVALIEVPASHWPAFDLRATDRSGLLTGIEHSLTYLDAPSAAEHFPIAGISKDRVRRGLERFRELLRSSPAPAALNRALRRDFRLYRSVGYDGRGGVLFTGYYTPIFDASRERTARFRHPIYKRPDDLISPADPKAIARQRLPGGGSRAYPTRAELEASGALRGLELAWLPEPYDPYNVQVQGSAKLRLRDGSIMEVGYDGTNGHPYVAIGRELVKDGHLRPHEVSLRSIRAFFRAHPQLLPQYTRRNPRFVFFTQTQGGPYGSLGQEVTADVSIATDKEIFPRAALTWVHTSLGNERGGRPYAAFRLDHDTGGAIRAPGMCDLYMGEGAYGESRAGRQRAEGLLYYLVAR
ncbi:MAG: MltA domain-containing protein [Planctomycetota bacterium]